MAFGWASDDQSLRQLPVTEIAARFKAANIRCRYYTRSPCCRVRVAALYPQVAGLAAFDTLYNSAVFGFRCCSALS